MLTLRPILAMAVVMMMALGADVVQGQGYPNKPIRIVTGAIGGGNDFVARLIAPSVSLVLGQPLIVDNRNSGTGDIVSKAGPDGYTLLMEGSSFWIGPLALAEKPPYDVVKDFSPITLVIQYPTILVVHPSLTVASVAELISLAKTKPNTLNYATGGAGGSIHLAAELFDSMADVKMTRVDYRGSGPALNGVLIGEVQMTFATANAALPLIKSGKLKGLAVTSAQPTALAPGLPTVAASGLPGYESLSLSVLFAPAKTPLSIVNRLNQEFVRALNATDVKERLLNAGVESRVSTPEQAAATVKSDVAKWDKVIRDAGIKLQ